MPLTSEVRELEGERRPVEIELEAVSERPPALAQGPGNGRDGQVWLSLKVLSYAVDDRPLFDDPL